MRKKVFFDEAFREGLIPGAAVGLIMHIASIRRVFSPRPVLQFAHGGITDKIMIAVRAYQKPGEDIYPVSAAMPGITLRKYLNAVEPVRGNGGRAEVRDATVFALV